jgi:hypothetical protein
VRGQTHERTSYDCPQARPGTGRPTTGRAGHEQLTAADPLRDPRRGSPRPALDRLVKGLQVSGEAGETIISGRVGAQPALHGVLVKMRDLGMCLISVRRLEQGEPGTQPQK